MRYNQVLPATFLARPNRFVAEVLLPDIQKLLERLHFYTQQVSEWSL